jgi:hypothetical protein
VFHAGDTQARSRGLLAHHAAASPKLRQWLCSSSSVLSSLLPSSGIRHPASGFHSPCSPCLRGESGWGSARDLFHAAGRAKIPALFIPAIRLQRQAPVARPRRDRRLAGRAMLLPQAHLQQPRGLPRLRQSSSQFVHVRAVFVDPSSVLRPPSSVLSSAGSSQSRARRPRPPAAPDAPAATPRTPSRASPAGSAAPAPGHPASS